jgi:hypothetical protein
MTFPRYTKLPKVLCSRAFWDTGATDHLAIKGDSVGAAAKQDELAEMAAGDAERIKPTVEDVAKDDVLAEAAAEDNELAETVSKDAERVGLDMQTSLRMSI